MYILIVFGVFMLIIAVSYLFKVKLFLKKSVISTLSEAELTSYQRRAVFPFTLLGILHITIGIIYNMDWLSHSVLMAVLIISSSIPFILLFRNNKKHLGYYFW